MVRKLNWIAARAMWITLCVIIGTSSPAADGPPKPGDTGMTVGTVTEITGEFLRIQIPGDVPHRHWFKWIGPQNATPDKDVLAAVAKIKVGDTVEIKWTLNDRKRIESVKLAVPGVAETPKAEAKKEEPKKEPAKEVPAGNTLKSPEEPKPQPEPIAVPKTNPGEVANVLIDDLVSTGNRLLELPLFMLLSIVGVVGAVSALLVGRWFRKEGKVGFHRATLAIVAVIVVLSVAYVADSKIGRVQNEVRELRSKQNADTIEVLDAIRKGNAGRKSFLFDLTESESLLTKRFGQAKVMPVVYDEATDVVQVRIVSPVAHAYLAIVDLQHPAIEIKLGIMTGKKRLTSEFARESNCTVAINGEAGRSPQPDSGLGEWTGNLVYQGKVILQENAKNTRPFLSFDRTNRAAYSPAAANARPAPTESYNVIWGRTDVLLEGNAPPPDATRQPRTVMAINKDGSRLYLLVVDGRQPNYSMGFSRADVGDLLKAFGAHSGMLCDEGGSSCFYVKKFGGISNIPCDNLGQERPTYTHFGITLRGSE